jgi:hypothetical protein
LVGLLRFLIGLWSKKSISNKKKCIFALKINYTIMETNVRVQEVSVVDALLTIYRQQNERVRRDFLVRIRQEDSLLDMPGMRTREEMMQVSRERMSDIIAGREQTLTHDEVMKLVDGATAKTETVCIPH